MQMLKKEKKALTFSCFSSELVVLVEALTFEGTLLAAVSPRLFCSFAAGPSLMFTWSAPKMETPIVKKEEPADKE